MCLPTKENLVLCISYVVLRNTHHARRNTRMGTEENGPETYLDLFITTICQPTLTTGISIMTIANAVEETAKEDKDLRIAYWLRLKSEGFLKEKYPIGVEVDKRLLEKGGFRVRQKGKKYFVKNYQNYTK